MGRHSLEGAILLRDHSIRRKDFEFLQPHYFLLQRPFRNQSININHFLLPYSVGTVHRLEIFHWIPVMFHKNYLKTRKNKFKTKNNFFTVSAPVRLSPSPPTRVVSNKTSIVGSVLNLLTTACRCRGGTLPSSRKNDTAGRCWVSTRWTTSSMSRSWQKMRARCWVIGMSLPTPIPQSRSNCLAKFKLFKNSGFHNKILTWVQEVCSRDWCHLERTFAVLKCAWIFHTAGAVA